jgi:hypothetical protein
VFSTIHWFVYTRQSVRCGSRKFTFRYGWLKIAIPLPKLRRASRVPQDNSGGCSSGTNQPTAPRSIWKMKESSKKREPQNGHSKQDYKVFTLFIYWKIWYKIERLRFEMSHQVPRYGFSIQGNFSCAESYIACFKVNKLKNSPDINTYKKNRSTTKTTKHISPDPLVLIILAMPEYNQLVKFGLYEYRFTVTVIKF